MTMKLYKTDEEKKIEEIKTAAFKEDKIKGSRSFAKIVKTMRDYQNRYFQTKSTGALKDAKKAEERVDQALEVILK